MTEEIEPTQRRARMKDVSLTLQADAPVTRGGSDVKTDDAQLLRALHDEHGHALWAYVVGLTNGDRAQAQDVVQETFLRAWRNPQVLLQTTGSARGWLFTVAKRIVIDEWRTARSRRERVTAELPERPVPDATDHAVDRHIVTAAMRTLSMEHREVLLECYFRGSSVAQAAAALGVPAGTIKSRTHYALRALRLALEEMGGEL
ncbi:MAG: polymerase sigma-70 factor, subfamily [Pseudonocardiales bacterium]|jgi:RNA polymerase sigma-70 factor (ECF subfamily)|nr:polymerase sigma-70 factor, subfamily [Pseudonocardiales bacterium]